MPAGRLPRIGEPLVQADLGRTLRRLAAAEAAAARAGGRRAGLKAARDLFYRGEIAGEIARFSRENGGLLDYDDLASFSVGVEPPIKITYRDYELYGCGPWSQGPTLPIALNIVEGYDLRSLGHNSPHYLHLIAEALKAALSDRHHYIADPDFFDVPLEGLLSDSFAAERRSLIDETHVAASPVAPGDPYDNQGDQSKPPHASATISHPAQSTTHLVVSDTKGNVVSYTFTIESTGGNAIVVPGYGFLMNNELTDFNFDSTTHPNRADGDKRPRSSMSPTIVTRNGQPFLAVGSPGGSTIPGTVLEILLGRLDLGDTLPQAIARPRAVQRNTATDTAEPGFINSPEGQALVGYGHSYSTTAEIGAATGIEFLGGGQTLAAAEPVRRGGGSAAVVAP
jgi:gamma-glutamyltranspeptidase/glutathione hydrolase